MKSPGIRVGNQTSCNVAARLPFEFAINNAFDAFEWFSDPGSSGWDEDSFSAFERAELRCKGQEHGILFSVHAPWVADPTTHAGIEAIMRSIHFAEDVGAGLVNFHLFPEHEARLYTEALKPLIKAAQMANIRLSLENTRQCSPEDCNEVFAIFSAMPEAAGRVGMCLDMGHANLFPGTHNDCLNYVDRLSEQVPIIHWHAHENWGDNDSHLPLFTGPSARDESVVRALIQRLKKRGFAGSVVMEQWPQPPEILISTRQHLLQLWNECK
ncbi:MAG: sugar phosphate isomerase/epimerase [Candidatus Riflebacteria bacterium]|nr:sugar phosphate isomerase/epimerase [Candidatus Riflebacteria bacterium]